MISNLTFNCLDDILPNNLTLCCQINAKNVGDSITRQNIAILKTHFVLCVVQPNIPGQTVLHSLGVALTVVNHMLPSTRSASIFLYHKAIVDLKLCCGSTHRAVVSYLQSEGLLPEIT